MEQELSKYQKDELPVDDIGREIMVKGYRISRNTFFNVARHSSEPTYLAFVEFKIKPSKRHFSKLASWLKVRIKSNNLKLITN